MKTITYDDFMDTYKPIKNTLDESAGYDGCMFETYGDELKKVMDTPHGYVWTLLEADDGSLVIGSGYHLVNRMGYFITEKPYEDDIEVIDED